MKKKLNIRFEMSDLGPLSYFLGIAVTGDENGLHLSQERYAKEILRQFQFSSSHPCSTPLSPGTKLSKESGALLSQHDATLYQRIVGSIMYLMLATRPDLSYAVGAVSQFSIDIQHHFVKEKVEGGEVSLEYTPTAVMVADCLTKALPREKFVQHRASMGIY